MKDVQSDLFGDNYVLTLTTREPHHFRKSIAPGQWGGHQRLLADFQAREAGTGRLRATAMDLGDAYWKAEAYGNGTWQKAFRAIVSAATRAGWQPTEALRRRAEAHLEVCWRVDSRRSGGMGRWR